MNDLDPHLPPLDPEVEELLRCERDRPRVGAARAEKMWGVIATELVVTAVPAVAQAAPLPAATNPLASLAGTAGKLALVKALPWVAVSLSVASVGGFVAGQKIASQRLARSASASRMMPAGANTASSVSAVDLPSEMPPAPLVQLPGEPEMKVESSLPAATAPLLMAAPLRPVVHRKAIARQKVSAPDDLAAEAQMVARAEIALRAGDWAGALAESDDYARRFPDGQLAEEAAYLGVRACEGSGDAVATQVRLTELRRRFPRSPLALPVASSPAGSVVGPDQE